MAELKILIDYQCRRQYHILDDDEESGILNSLLELKTIRKIDIPGTLKYAEEAGAACEEMKHGIEAVISELEDETIDDDIVDDLDLGELGGINYAIRIINKHLSKYLDG